MDSDWTQVAAKVIALGAPILGGALGGPLGAAAGKILADTLGAIEPTPAAVNAAIEAKATDGGAPTSAVQEAETRFEAALAEIGRTQVAEVNATLRAEAVSLDPLQRWWRPLYALELSLLECPAFALTLLRAVWLGHESGINGMANLSGLLITYFAARFGVLGVYVSGRTREKQAALTGSPVPSAIAEVAKAVTRRR